MTTYRSSHLMVFREEGVLRNFANLTGKRLCQRLFFIKKGPLVQVFSCEFCEISKNTFFQRTPPVAASELMEFELKWRKIYIWKLKGFYRSE